MYRQIQHFTLLAFALQALYSSATVADPAPTANQAIAAAQCRAILVDSMTAQGEWSSVHAAEYLIRLEEKPPVLVAFRPQSASATPQYRIGVWRVLAQAETTPESRNRYLQQIRDVLLNLQAEDRLHALESLAKLHAPITSPTELGMVQQLADSTDDPGRSFAIWRLIQADWTPELVQNLLDELKSSQEVQRLRAAFVLGQLNELPQSVQTKIEEVFATEPQDSIAFPYLAIATGGEHLTRLMTSENPAHQALALKELTQRGVDFPYNFASGTAESSPLALRQAAAFALLAKQRKSDVQQNQ